MNKKNVDYLQYPHYRRLLEEMLGSLEPEERRLIYMRYFQDMTQVEIARILGISQVQVSRKEKAILQKMKNRMQHP